MCGIISKNHGYWVYEGGVYVRMYVWILGGAMNKSFVDPYLHTAYNVSQCYKVKKEDMFSQKQWEIREYVKLLLLFNQRANNNNNEKVLITTL